MRLVTSVMFTHGITPFTSPCHTYSFTACANSHLNTSKKCDQPVALALRFRGVFMSCVPRPAIPCRPAAKEATCGRLCRVARFCRFWRVTIPATEQQKNTINNNNNNNNMLAVTHINSRNVSKLDKESEQFMVIHNKTISGLYESQCILEY